uniref:Uncharacterized protein n=1 Tax=Ciona savignyi TaxID=51511 RepID=H2Y559_CIOSA
WTSKKHCILRLLLGLMVAAELFSDARADYDDDYRCEPIHIKMCQGIGYNSTRLPNSLGQVRQTEGDTEMKSFQILLEYNCASELKHFLCAVFVPMCEPGIQRTIGPCEGMCLSVQKLCLPALESFGQKWPEKLNCSNFPKENKQNSMCMPGKVEIQDEELPSYRPTPVRRNYCKYPERPIILIAMCYNIYSISYILRLLVGRENISCQRNSEGEMFLIKVKFRGNTVCAIVFLLSYFFGMASYLWWVILTLTWFLAAGMKWSHEAIERHSSYFHLVAWSIPSIKIVVILILRHVRLCYVGNQDMNALTGFVLAPLFTYLVIGTSFLLAGFFSLFRIKSYMEKEGSKTDKLERLMVKIGVFSVLYIVPASIVIGCYFYEHAVRRLWSLNRNVTPSVSIYFLRILMQLIIGVFTGFWVWSKKSIQSW